MHAGVWGVPVQVDPSPFSVFRMANHMIFAMLACSVPRNYG